uniref:A superfamily conotoxin Lv1.9 n=2 Tax=Conus TaxID=6490 RepID=S4UJD4_CONLI|nr:A-conotoxin peptide precursor Fla1.8 [Conus flavidus]AGK23160.1 A superfamily conotoxin Lv1.9 precursor [Conus lividus]
MGMRMMLTVFLLVVLATTVVSDHASDGRNTAAKVKYSKTQEECCPNPPCFAVNSALCGARR